MTEPKRYDPDKDKIPAGHYKIVWDCASEKNVLVQVIENNGQKQKEFPCSLCKKEFPKCGYNELMFDMADDARCPGFLHV